MISTAQRRLERSSRKGVAVHEPVNSSRRLDAAFVGTQGVLAMNFEPTPRSVALANELATVPIRRPKIGLAEGVTVTTPHVKSVPSLSEPKRFPIASIDFSKA